MRVFTLVYQVVLLVLSMSTFHAYADTDVSHAIPADTTITEQVIEQEKPIAKTESSKISSKTANTITPEKTKKVVAEVMDDARYGSKKTVTRWKSKNEKEKSINDDEGDISEWLRKLFGDGKSNSAGVNIAKVAELLMWIFFAILAVYILTQLGKWSGWLGTMQSGKVSAVYEQPTELFGLSLSEDSLPTDIVTQAKQLLAEGNMREAVALLYRASLVRLIRDHGLEIAASATEFECQTLVRSTQPERRVTVFNQLTSLWLQTAYDRGNPTDAEVLAVCEQWTQQFTPREGAA